MCRQYITGDYPLIFNSGQVALSMLVSIILTSVSMTHTVFSFMWSSTILNIYFPNFPGVIPPEPHYGRGRPPPESTASTAFSRARPARRPPQCLAQIGAHDY